MTRVYHHGLGQLGKGYCFDCKEILPKSEFHKDKSRRNGVSSRCKECEKKRGKNRRTYFRDYHEAKKEAKHNGIATEV